MNKVSEQGIEPHEAWIKPGEVVVHVDVYTLNAEFSCSDLEAKALTRSGEEAEMECVNIEGSGRRLRVVLKPKDPRIDKLVFEDESTRFIAVYMNAKLRGGRTVSYPIIAVVSATQ